MADGIAHPRVDFDGRVECACSPDATAQRGLVFKAHRLSYHSTLGSRVVKKKRREREAVVNTSEIELD